MYRRAFRFRLEFLQNRRDGPVVEFVITRDVDDRDRPVPKEIKRGRAVVDITCQNQKLCFRGGLNESLAWEVTGYYFEVQV